MVQGEAAAFGDMGPRGRGTGHGVGREGHRPRVRLRLVEQVMEWARGLAHGRWRGVCLVWYGMVWYDGEPKPKGADLLRAEPVRSS